MNHYPGRWCWLIFVIALLGGVPPPQAAMVYTHDKSGNVTRGYSTSSAPFSTILSNSVRTILVSNQLSLSVVAEGVGPFTYQWWFEDTMIAGATNATFFKTNVSASDSGWYSVVVTGANGSQTAHAGLISVLASANTLYAVASKLGPDRYVAVGEKGTIVTSQDLIQWTQATSGTSSQLESIAFGNGIFVAVGTNATILTSGDGTTWTLRNAGNTNHLRGITFGNGLFVAVGSGGTTLTSPDGITWTTRTFDYPRLEAVTFGGSRFVVVGTAGTIWTSTNGVNWINRTWATDLTLNAVTYGNGEYVAVGAGGLILSSTDGTNWFRQTAGTSHSFESVLHFNNSFIALGPVGRNFISANGTNWDDSISGTFEPLYGSTLGYEIVVAVGKNGTILRIPQLLIDHFEWSAISSPQRIDNPIAATITARDAANNTVTDFNGVVTLTATSTQNAITNSILSDPPHTDYATATNAPGITAGYSFTPSADLLVTHFRHYNGTRISLWDSREQLLASMNVASVPETWKSTPLPAPVLLQASKTYFLATYSPTPTFYLRYDLPRTFPHGTINQSLYATGNTFPANAYYAFWMLVDLSYVVQGKQGLLMTPTTATFTNGVANVNPWVFDPADGVGLTAMDNTSQSGSSNPFNVYGDNDLAVTVIAAPSPAAVSNNLTYTVRVMNAGPNSATTVNVTNPLPPNVSFVSANPSQGSCQFASGQVTCSLGTLGGQSAATISITTTPIVPGVMLTNTVTVWRAEAESNLANNSATVITYVPPALSIVSSKSYYEGNLGVAYGYFDVTLSSPTILSVAFTGATADGSATKGSDYVALNATHLIPPGVSVWPVWVGVQGDTVIEANETFYVNVSSITNATLVAGQSTVTLVNDDGLPGQIHFFQWNPVSSPQRTNQPFAIAITARDAANNVATNFTGMSSLRGVNIGGASSRTILTNDVHEGADNLGLFTLGYEFTPTNDMFVTHVRHYFGSKVSLWTQGGFLLASRLVESIPGEWAESELQTPVFLKANDRYRLGVFSGGNAYYWRRDATTSFTNGMINQSYYAVGDAFPALTDSVKWHMVDVRHSAPASISPATSGNFTSGSWSGNLSVQELGTNFALMADDGSGHIGFANRFGVYQNNDLAVTMTNNPIAPAVNSSLIYTIRVLNAGPDSSTNVFLTNSLPLDAIFVSAVPTQGTCSQTNGVVTCALGNLSALGSASVTITVTPTVVGALLTNAVIAVRDATDPYPANNEAVSVLIASVGLSLLLQSGADLTGVTWRSDGQEFWTNQTVVTHDGVDAAQSGPIVHGQQSRIFTTVRGPGTLNFWWKVSSQAGGDVLRFSTNLIIIASISGEMGWEQRTFQLPAGLHTIMWNYIKDGSISAGSDAGWLDQVTYTVPSFYFSSPKWTNSALRVNVNGTNGQRVIFQASSDFIRWTSFSTNTLSSTSVPFIITPAAGATHRFYRLTHRND